MKRPLKQIAGFGGGAIVESVLNGRLKPHLPTLLGKK